MATLPSERTADAVLVGFVVSRAVGNAVVRNRVKRRLRAAMAQRLTGLPPGSRLVLRAGPPASTAPAARLAADVEQILARLVAREVTR